MKIRGQKSTGRQKSAGCSKSNRIQDHATRAIETNGESVHVIDLLDRTERD